MNFLRVFALSLCLSLNVHAAEPVIFKVDCKIFENGVSRPVSLAYTKSQIGDILRSGTSNLADLGVSFAPYSASLTRDMYNRTLAFTFKISKSKKNLFGKQKEVEISNQTYYVESGMSVSMNFSEMVNGNGISCAIANGVVGLK